MLTAFETAAIFHTTFIAVKGLYINFIDKQTGCFYINNVLIQFQVNIRGRLFTQIYFQ